MRRKKEGPTQSERMMSKLDEVLDCKSMKIIDDIYFKPEVEGGVKFHVRRGDFLRTKAISGINYGRLYDVPDEIMLRQRQMAKNEEIEATRDKTFDEFMEMFGEHIEGKVDPNTRVGGRPDTATAREKKESIAPSQKRD